MINSPNAICIYFIHFPDFGKDIPKTPINKKGMPTPTPKSNIFVAAVNPSRKLKVVLFEAIPIRILTTTGPTQAEDSRPALMPIR